VAFGVVGFFVGFFVGFLVGFFVGFLVGFFVGTGVGVGSAVVVSEVSVAVVASVVAAVDSEVVAAVVAFVVVVGASVKVVIEEALDFPKNALGLAPFLSQSIAMPKTMNMPSKAMTAKTRFLEDDPNLKSNPARFFEFEMTVLASSS